MTSVAPAFLNSKRYFTFLALAYIGICLREYQIVDIKLITNRKISLRPSSVKLKLLRQKNAIKNFKKTGYVCHTAGNARRIL